MIASVPSGVVTLTGAPGAAARSAASEIAVPPTESVSTPSATAIVKLPVSVSPGPAAVVPSARSLSSTEPSVPGTAPSVRPVIASGSSTGTIGPIVTVAGLPSAVPSFGV